MADVSAADLQLLKDASRDPVITDGDKYKVVMENDRVRVLEYRDAPGQRTSPHFHPDYVLCALNSFTRKFTMPDGASVVREVKAGAVVSAKGHSHIGENVGTTDTHVIIVEIKAGN
jgi:hypothetical protein